MFWQQCIVVDERVEKRGSRRGGRLGECAGSEAEERVVMPRVETRSFLLKNKHNLFYTESLPCCAINRKQAGKQGLGRALCVRVCVFNESLLSVEPS